MHGRTGRAGQGLTRMSRPPSSSRTHDANAATEAGSATSRRRNRTAPRSGPLARSAAAAASPRASSRAVTTTHRPCSASRAASACPMPRFAPVTTATVSPVHHAAALLLDAPATHATDQGMICYVDLSSPDDDRRPKLMVTHTNTTRYY